MVWSARAEDLAMAIGPGGGLGHTELTGSTGAVLSEREQNFAVNLKQAGFDRAGTTKPPHEAC
jgi:hypothetical protein